MIGATAASGEAPSPLQLVPVTVGVQVVSQLLDGDPRRPVERRHHG